MPQLSITGALTLTVLAFAGCAENRYCASPDTYESAPSIPAIQSVGDVKVSLNPDAYLIPPVPANPVPFGQKIPDPNKTRWSCLDQPPRLTSGSTAAAPAAKS
jgi:hypothetical protein